LARPPSCVIGVDAALRNTGVGVVVSGPAAPAVREFGVIRCPDGWPHTRALRHLHDELAGWLQRHRPDALAIEGLFYCRNVRTAIALGEARGVVLMTAAAAGVPVFEYAPRSVKQAMVGSGGARKEQVAKMVVRMTGLDREPSEDAADALAVALCHAQRRASIWPGGAAAL